MEAKDILFNIVYIVVMKKCGDDEFGHSYVVGAFNSLDKAIEIDNVERDFRGGKYEYVIEACELNVSRKDSKCGIYRPAKSQEMNCIVDSEKSILYNQERFNDYYNKKQIASLKNQLEEAQKHLQYW